MTGGATRTTQMHAGAQSEPNLLARFTATPISAPWAKVEVSDPVRIFAGRISEVEIAGQTMLRIETPGVRDGRARVRIFSVALVRDIEPCREAEALDIAALQPRFQGSVSVPREVDHEV